MYACDHTNKFEEIQKHAEKLQNLVGPVYQHTDHTNHFQQIIQTNPALLEGRYLLKSVNLSVGNFITRK